MPRDAFKVKLTLRFVKPSPQWDRLWSWLLSEGPTDAQQGDEAKDDGERGEGTRRQIRNSSG